MMKPFLFLALFGTWFALVATGRAVSGEVNVLLFASCLMVLTPVVQGRHPFA
jgi:hypothetical protein